MLEYINITNFQKHRKFRIDFDKYLTVLVGSNDSGKSTIIRALKWVFLNKPNGSDFISWDTDEARIEVGIDQHKIIRKKGKENLYFLDKQKFTAFGNDIPEAIQSLTEIDFTNFQFQLDNPFWFLQTAGENARELNQIVNLGLIDKVFAEISSELKSIRSVISVSEDRLKDNKKERKSIEWSVQADVQLKSLEKKSQNIEEMRLKRSKIDDLVKKIVSLTESNESRKNACNAFSVILAKFKQIQELKQKEKKLKGLIQQWKELQQKKKQTIPIDALNSLKEKAEKIREIRTKLRQINSLLSDTKELKKELKEANAKKDKLEQQLHKMTNGRCPICGSSNLLTERSQNK